MKPFLFLATRIEDAAADAEYASILRLGSLAEHELHRVRLEAAPMPTLDLDAYSGVIVGGSPFTSSVPTAHKSDTQLRVEAELGELLTELRARDFPFFGACYGVGTLGQHIGAVIDNTYGEPISAPLIHVTAAGRSDPVLAGLPASFQAYVGHKEACTSLPAEAVLLATSEACPVQMFRVGDNLYGTQFHPELDLDGLLERMAVYRHAGYFRPDEVAEIHAEVSAADVSAAGQVLTNFIDHYRAARG